VCDPTGGILTTAVIVAATAYSAYSTYQAGKAQNEYANYEAEQTEAKAEHGAAQVEADRIRKMGRQAVAEQSAAIAGSGAQIGSAGSLALNREIYRGSEEDAVYALLGGGDRAARLNAQGRLTRARGRAAKSAATSSAFSQVAQGGMQASSAWRSRPAMTNASGQQTRWYVGNQPGKG
jgi:hypothetical protein